MRRRLPGQQAPRGGHALSVYALEVMRLLVEHAEETGEKRTVQELAPDLYQELVHEAMAAQSFAPQDPSKQMKLMVHTPWGGCEIRVRPDDTEASTDLN